MTRDSLPLHPKYGVNPSMVVCACCGEETGEIVLLGNNYKGEAPRRIAISIEPCDKCREKYKDKVIICIVKSENDMTPLHYRAVDKEIAKHIFSKHERLDDIINGGFAVMDKNTDDCLCSMNKESSQQEARS